jgi:hypothetical protein
MTSILSLPANFSKFVQGSEFKYPFTSSGKSGESFNVFTSTSLKIYLESSFYPKRRLLISLSKSG